MQFEDIFRMRSDGKHIPLNSSICDNCADQAQRDERNLFANQLSVIVRDDKRKAYKGFTAYLVDEFIRTMPFSVT